MSLQGRIEELTKRHAKIDQQIHEEQKRPASDDTTTKRSQATET